jgi:hypothetical protein
MIYMNDQSGRRYESYSIIAICVIAPHCLIIKVTEGVGKGVVAS